MTDKKLPAKKTPPKKTAAKISKKPKFQEGKHVIAKDLAEMLGVQLRRVRELGAQNILLVEETQSGPRYLLKESLVNYIKHLKSNEEKKSLDDRKSAADARIKEAKADKDEFMLQLMRNELHRAEHVQELFNFTISETRSQLLSHPDRCAIDCANAKTPIEAREILKKSVYDILTYLSQLDYDPKKYAEMVKEDGIYSLAKENPTGE